MFVQMAVLNIAAFVDDYSYAKEKRKSMNFFLSFFFFSCGFGGGGGGLGLVGGGVGWRGDDGNGKEAITNTAL